MSDMVNKPSHYVEGRSIEPWDVIDDWGLPYHLGNAVKYVSRAGRKDDLVQDLEKAIASIGRHLEVVARDVQRGVLVGDVVRAVEADDTPMLVPGVEYVVAAVNAGPVRTFVALADQPSRYWDVTRFEVIV